MDITKEEESAIKALKKLARKWPKSLWLWSGSGTLWIMKCKPDGTRGETLFGAVDPDYIVDSVDITNDGGDW